LPAATALGLLLWLCPARRARSDNFVFYLPNGRHLVTMQTLDHVHYAPLLAVLNVVGAVQSVEEKRSSLKLSIGGQRLEVHAGERKLKLNKHEIKIENPVREEDGVWLVPLDFFDSVLPKLTTQTVRYRAGDERMFIGNLQPITYSTHLSPIAGGARLTVQFTGPVTVQTASTNGQWIVFLGDNSLVPLESQIQFQNRYVTAMRFDDQDGVPKLIIAPGEAGLNFYPKVTEGGRTFEAEVIQPAAAAVQTANGGQPSAGGAAAPSSGGGAPSPAGSGQSAAPGAAAHGAAQAEATPGGAAVAPPAPRLPIVVLDAGHGGPDAGAHSRDGVTERDLVAALAERVRAALTAGGKVRVLMTRQGASDPGIDERDAMANLARPAAFVTFHAGDLGGAAPAVEVYTYAAPSAPDSAAEPPTLFVPWNEAQQAHLARSRDLAGLVAKQLKGISGLEARDPNQAPVRQLRSVDAPAVALELGTLAPDQDAAALNAPAFQDQVAKAVAEAISELVQGAS